MITANICAELFLLVSRPLSFFKFHHMRNVRPAVPTLTIKPASKGQTSQWNHLYEHTTGKGLDSTRLFGDMTTRIINQIIDYWVQLCTLATQYWCVYPKKHALLVRDNKLTSRPLVVNFNLQQQNFANRSQVLVNRNLQ